MDYGDMLRRKKSAGTVYLVHGMHTPFAEHRSTDWLADRLRADGFIVRELRYDWYDVESQLDIALELQNLRSDDLVIAHSWGGILADLFSNARHIDVATLHSDIKGTSDWLFEVGDPEWLPGLGHSIDNETMYNAILAKIEERA